MKHVLALKFDKLLQEKMRDVINELVHACSCTYIESVWMHLRSLESTQKAWVALTLLSCSPNFPRTSITRYTGTLSMNQFFSSWLRASSYEPGNRAGSITGTNFCCLFIWEISAQSTGWNPRNTTKMVEHKLVSFAAVAALWTLLTLLIKLIYIQDKNYAIFGAMSRKRSYFV